MHWFSQTKQMEKLSYATTDYTRLQKKN